MNKLEADGTEDENQIITLEIKEKRKNRSGRKIKEWKRQFSSIFDIFKKYLPCYVHYRYNKRISIIYVMSLKRG